MLAKQLKRKQKNKKLIFHGMLLGVLGTTLLGNLFTGKVRLEHVKEHLQQVVDEA